MNQSQSTWAKEIRDTLFCRSISGNNHLRVAAYAAYLDERLYERELDALYKRIGEPQTTEEEDSLKDQAAQRTDGALREIDPRLSDVLGLQGRLEQTREQVKTLTAEIQAAWKDAGEHIASGPHATEAWRTLERAIRLVDALKTERDEARRKAETLEAEFRRLTAELDAEWGPGRIGEHKPIWV